jgi:hypothetical protein
VNTFKNGHFKEMDKVSIFQYDTFSKLHTSQRNDDNMTIIGEKLSNIQNDFESKKYSKIEISKKWGISRTTLDKLIKNNKWDDREDSIAISQSLSNAAAAKTLKKVSAKKKSAPTKLKKEIEKKIERAKQEAREIEEKIKETKIQLIKEELKVKETQALIEFSNDIVDQKINSVVEINDDYMENTKNIDMLTNVVLDKMYNVLIGERASKQSLAPFLVAQKILKEAVVTFSTVFNDRRKAFGLDNVVNNFQTNMQVNNNTPQEIKIVGVEPDVVIDGS